MRGIRITPNNKAGNAVLLKYLEEQKKLSVTEKLVYMNAYKLEFGKDEDLVKHITIWSKTRFIPAEGISGTTKEILSSLGATNKDYTITIVEE